MKSRNKFLSIIGILVCMFILFSFPICSLAAEDIPTVQIPDSVTDTIPDAFEISDNPNDSIGISSTLSTRTMSIYAAGSSVSGGCRITKLSSSSVQISGYSVTAPSDPGLKVTLQLQVYYDGRWHTSSSSYKSVSGTRVDLTRTYNVTSGYYYRVSATHALADGTSSTSRTNSIFVG